MNIKLVRQSQNLICIVALLGLLRWGLIISDGLSKHGYGGWILGQCVEGGQYLDIAILAGISIYWLKEPKNKSDSN